MVSPPGTPILEATRLGRRRPDGQGWLLDDVSLDVRAGARLGLVGPSGSGKTLLLRALAVLDPIDAGRLLWGGRPLRRDRVPRFRAEVIYLHQRAAMLEDTVEAALRRPFQLAVHHRRKYDPERVTAWLGRLGRDRGFLAKRSGDLSGGETQIVALLRALQLEPRVLLLDEPTAALDYKTAAAVEALVADWLAEGDSPRATVWVSHAIDQTRRMADRLIALDGGRIANWQED